MGIAQRASRIGNRLRELRRARGMSQVDLAQVVGVSRQTIASIEIGQYCPSTLLALQLARALDRPVEGIFWLVGEADGG